MFSLLDNGTRNSFFKLSDKNFDWAAVALVATSLLRKKSKRQMFFTTTTSRPLASTFRFFMRYCLLIGCARSSLLCLRYGVTYLYDSAAVDLLLYFFQFSLLVLGILFSLVIIILLLVALFTFTRRYFLHSLLLTFVSSSFFLSISTSGQNSTLFDTSNFLFVSRFLIFLK